MTRYELRVDLEDFNGTSRYAKYSEFKVASASLKYKLISLGSYSGTAGIIIQHVFSQITRHTLKLNAGYSAHGVYDAHTKFEVAQAPLPSYSVFTADTLRYAGTMTFDL